MAWKNWGDHPIIVGIGVVCSMSGLGYAIYDHHLKQEDTQKISTKPLETSGLYLATTTLMYPDGDQLKADFRVFCPTFTIRPTNYVLMDSKGIVKKQGAWWEPAFTPTYDSERQLVKEVCGNK
jgi:hypothetical protein